ncbi:MAG TPA: hypothetical protein PLX97_01620 [Gemmatales bacterium]|nr:hypothetical protein [Gemmatales bacterium]
MAIVTDNETWLVEIGDAVIRKKASEGAALLPWERLIYCMWCADYGMNNAGDLATAADVYKAFQSEGLQLATELKLPITMAAFALSRKKLEKQYFDRFEAICDELKQARPADAVEVRVRRTRHANRAGEQGAPNQITGDDGS